jgi:hypothetical protein
MSDEVQASDPMIVTEDGVVVYDPPRKLFQPCIGCMREGADTAFLVRGEPDFLAAAYVTFVGMTEEDAVATVEARYRTIFDRPPASDPRQQDWTILLCRDCARKAPRKPPLHTLKTIEKARDKGTPLAPAAVLDRSGYGEFVFKRLRVIAMEDVGLADPNVIVQVQALYQVWTDLRKKREDKNDPWRLALVMATMVCAKAAKSRAVDHALLAFYGEDEVREIPDWALDKHTSRGWELGRGWKHFWDESTSLLDRKTGELVHEPIPDPYRARAIKVTRGKGKTRAVSTLTQER